ncbi:tRNA (cytidine(34)-2'-O)-methyltransferase [bacterium]|nr:tRNA (cytidine(34)-2'-O)-methyltransferase [bacterium]
MQIVLVEPQIPPNTGNIARLCAATQTTLHIVRPIPFRMDDKTLRRSGCDYWDHVKIVFHNSLEEFLCHCERSEAIPSEQLKDGDCRASNEARNDRGENLYFFSKKVTKPYTSVKYHKNDYLIFGSETYGLSEEIIKKHPEQTLTIPMSGPVRSLNLSTSVGIVLYEALRQVNEW